MRRVRMVETQNSFDQVKSTVTQVPSGTVRTYRSGDLFVVSAEGLFSLPLLRALEEQAHKTAGSVGIDLAELTSLRPALVSALERVRRRLARRGNRVILLNPPDQLLELLALHGFREKYVVEDNLLPAEEDTGEEPENVRRFSVALRETEKLEQSLATCEGRIAAFLPRSLPFAEHFRFEVCWRPSERVGGDFYDFINLGEGKIAVTVGDVSGHGLPGAVVMGMAKKVLRLRALDMVGAPPAEVLCRVNSDFKEDLRETTFVTAIFAVLDTATGEVVLARAGHEFPLLVDPPRCEVRILRSAGLAVGLAGGNTFGETIENLSVQLQRGASLVMYSDGVHDARDPTGNRFGRRRLVESLAGGQPTGPLQAIIRALDCFTGTSAQEDDITLLTVTRL